MQRQRGELVPIGDALADLGGPVQAIRETPPPARRGFTLADQVNQLVSASEADPALGFMTRTMALCSLPRSNPGDRKEYKRVNGPFTLVNSGLPDRPGAVQGAKRRSGPLTARTDLESFRARGKGRRPVDKINHLGAFQSILLRDQAWGLFRAFPQG